MKKVLGISFGRKMQNCDIMVKQALLECQKAGNEIQFIRAGDLNINDCTGCAACVAGLVSGRGRGECFMKDDFGFLDNAVMEADAVIYGCPAYEISPSGTFKTVCDRFGPSHDISFRKVAIEEGLAAGKTEDQLPDQRSLKPRIAAFFSVGGAVTQNWLAFMLPLMYCFSFPLGMDVIDMYEYYGAMACEHVVGNDPVMERMTLMGRHISEALNAADPIERTKWRGDREGTCPVCHCDQLTVLPDKMSIECPVCGISGSFTVEDGRLEAHFSQEQQARSRLLYAGKLEHSTEIKTCSAHPGQIPDLRARLEKFIW